MKLQEHVLPLPTELWEIRRRSLPAGVRVIGKIVPEILNRYGLSLDELDGCRPQPQAPAFVPVVPHTDAMVELVATGNV